VLAGERSTGRSKGSRHRTPAGSKGGRPSPARGSDAPVGDVVRADEDGGEVRPKKSISRQEEPEPDLRALGGAVRAAPGRPGPVRDRLDPGGRPSNPRRRLRDEGCRARRSPDRAKIVPIRATGVRGERADDDRRTMLPRTQRGEHKEPRRLGDPDMFTAARTPVDPARRAADGGRGRGTRCPGRRSRREADRHGEDVVDDQRRQRDKRGSPEVSLGRVRAAAFRMGRR